MQIRNYERTESINFNRCFSVGLSKRNEGVHIIAYESDHIGSGATLGVYQYEPVAKCILKDINRRAELEYHYDMPADPPYDTEEVGIEDLFVLKDLDEVFPVANTRSMAEEMEEATEYWNDLSNRVFRVISIEGDQVTVNYNEDVIEFSMSDIVVLPASLKIEEGVI